MRTCDGVDELAAVLGDLAVDEVAGRPAAAAEAIRPRLEHGGVDAALVQAIRAGEPGEPGADHDHPLAAWLVRAEAAGQRARDDRRAGRAGTEPHEPPPRDPRARVSCVSVPAHRDNLTVVDNGAALAPPETPDRPRALFARFLRFGAIAWGGPAAQIELIKAECVEREGWVSDESFRRTLAVYQVLPGPEATELCVYFGRIRGGRLGGLAAGLGFVLPGFLLMLLFSYLYVEADLSSHLDEVFYGLSAAVAGLVARALLRLGRSFVTDVPLALIAVAAFVLTLTGALSFVFVLLAAGVAYELWRNAAHWARRANSLGARGRSPSPCSARSRSRSARSSSGRG